MQVFLIRDSEGKVYNEVNNPAAIIDKKLMILMKIGELEDMSEYLEYMKKQYTAHGFPEYADELFLLTLPKNQAEIDKVFNISNYVRTIYERMS